MFHVERTSVFFAFLRCASLFTRAPCCRSDHRSHLPFRRASLRWASFLGWISSAAKIRVSCVGGGLWGAWLVSLLVLRRTCVRLGVVPL